MPRGFRGLCRVDGIIVEWCRSGRRRCVKIASCIRNIVGVFEGCSRSDSSSNCRAEGGNAERCKFDSDHGHSPENGARAVHNDTVYIPLGTKPTRAASRDCCCTYNRNRNGEVIRQTYTRTPENDCKPTAVQSWRVAGRNVVSSFGLPMGIISSSFTIMISTVDGSRASAHV